MKQEYAKIGRLSKGGAVCYASDNKYCPVMGTSILSLLENNKHLKQLDLYILSNGLSKENQEKLKNLAGRYHRPCQIYELSKKLGTIPRLEKAWNVTIYARLFIPDILPEKLEHVFYIDADTLIIDDINDVFEAAKDGNKVIYGVLDRYNRGSIERLGLKVPIYINTGITLMNLTKWRKEDVSRRMMSMIGKRIWKFPDQDIINVALAGRIGILPPQYNMYMFSSILSYEQAMRLSYDGIDRYYSKADYEHARKNPSIIHFSGDLFNRPWQVNSRQTWHEKFDDYYRRSPWENVPYGKRFYTNKLSSSLYMALTERFLWDSWRKGNYEKFVDRYLGFEDMLASIKRVGIHKKGKEAG